MVCTLQNQFLLWIKTLNWTEAGGSKHWSYLHAGCWTFLSSHHWLRHMAVVQNWCCWLFTLCNTSRYPVLWSTQWSKGELGLTRLCICRNAVIPCESRLSRPKKGVKTRVSNLDAKCQGVAMVFYVLHTSWQTHAFHETDARDPLIDFCWHKTEDNLLLHASFCACTESIIRFFSSEVCISALGESNSHIIDDLNMWVQI